MNDMHGQDEYRGETAHLRRRKGITIGTGQNAPRITCKPIVEEPLLPMEVPPGADTGICDATMALAPYQCRWPVGDPLDPLFHYCGKSQLKSKSYCEDHDRMQRPGWQRKHPELDSKARG